MRPIALLASLFAACLVSAPSPQAQAAGTQRGLSPISAHFGGPRVRSHKTPTGWRTSFSARAPEGAVRAILRVRGNGTGDLRDHGRVVGMIEREVKVRNGRATITLPSPTSRHNYEQSWLDAEGRYIVHAGTARGNAPAIGTSRWDTH